jgi:hypothetical protein
MPSTIAKMNEATIIEDVKIRIMSLSPVALSIFKESVVIDDGTSLIALLSNHDGSICIIASKYFSRKILPCLAPTITQQYTASQPRNIKIEPRIIMKYITVIELL